MIVTLSWSEHMALSRGVRGRYNASAFHHGVEALYHHQGRFICPQISPGRVIGAGLCDSVRCDCLEYQHPGQQPCLEGWKRPPPQWLTKGDPEMHRRLRISHPGLFGKGQCYSQYLEDHMRSSSSVGHSLRGYYKADAMACSFNTRNESPGRDDVVVVNYMSPMVMDLDKNDGQLLGPMDWGWYRALDSDSLDFAGDDEGFGVYWCRDAGCRNYYRFG